MMTYHRVREAFSERNATMTIQDLTPAQLDAVVSRAREAQAEAIRAALAGLWQRIAHPRRVLHPV